MAAFSYHNNQSLVLGPPAYLATTTTTTTSSSIQMALAQPTDQAGGDLTNSSLPCFPFYYSPDAISEISANDVMAHESSSSLDSATKFPSLQAVEHLPTKQHASMEKKRKGRQRFLPSPAPSIDPKEGRRRKQKKCSNELKEAEEKPPNADVEKKNKNKASQEPPTGYIHVRARRGQATDSHSLAERVRREKISERMKMLQGLVPGCDKVIGKALMLDEIINYVQSLQNQVEFLSMKLASVNPILYDFGLDLDDYMVQAQKLESMSPQVPSVQQQQTHTTHIQPTAFAETTNNYPMVDSSVPFLLHGQGPSAFPQESNGFVMPMDDQSQRILHQLHFNDMSSSFQ